MTNLFIVLLVLYIPSAIEEVDSIGNDYTEHVPFFQQGELYVVPLVSLDHFNDLAKLKANEVRLLYRQQSTSQQLSNRAKILSEFQEGNAEQLIKLNHELWVSMTMDCQRNKRTSELTAFQAQTKRISILPQIKTLQWAVYEETEAYERLVNSTYTMNLLQLVFREEMSCESD